MYKITEIKLPEIDDLDYDEIRDIRSNIAEVTGLQDSDITICFEDQDNGKYCEL